MPATIDLAIQDESAQDEALAPKITRPTFAIRTDGYADVLVAYDFSAAAETALEYAEELSRHFSSMVHLLSIETPDEHARIMSTDPRVREHVHQDIKRAFSHIETRLRAKGIPCKSTFRVGDVPSVLEGTTLECSTDLVILGAFGHGPSDRASLGSTAAHILRVAQCPVLTIGPQAVRHVGRPPRIERLVCVTDSPKAHHELLTVCNTFASRLDARVELLRVVDPNHPGTARQEYEQQCEKLASAVRDKGIHASWALLYGPQAQVIAAHANEMKASLVILEVDRSDTNATALEHVIVETIRKVHCPVLTVPLLNAK